MEPTNNEPEPTGIKFSTEAKILICVFFILFAYSIITTMILISGLKKDVGPEIKQVSADLKRMETIADSAIAVAGKHKARADSFQRIVNRIDSNNIQIIRSYAPSKISSLTVAQRHAFADSVIYVHTKHSR